MTSYRHDNKEKPAPAVLVNFLFHAKVIFCDSLKDCFNNQFMNNLKPSKNKLLFANRKVKKISLPFSFVWCGSNNRFPLVLCMRACVFSQARRLHRVFFTALKSCNHTLLHIDRHTNTQKKKRKKEVNTTRQKVFSSPNVCWVFYKATKKEKKIQHHSSHAQ